VLRLVGQDLYLHLPVLERIDIYYLRLLAFFVLWQGARVRHASSIVAAARRVLKRCP